MNKTKKISEAGILSAIIILQAILILYVPVFGGIISIFWPTSFVILTKRNGYNLSVIVLFICFILVFLFTNFTNALILVLGFGIGGIGLGYSLKKEYSFKKNIIITISIFFISNVSLLYIIKFLTGIDLYDINQLKISFSNILQFYQKIEISKQQINEYQSTINYVIDNISKSLPAILFLIACSYTLINYWFSVKLLNRFGEKIRELPVFINLRFSKLYSLYFFICIILYCFCNSHNLNISKIINMNIIILLVFLLFIQGLSIIFFLFDKYKIKKMIRIIILFFLFYSSILTQLLILISIYDSFFDCRNLENTKNRDS